LNYTETSDHGVFVREVWETPSPKYPGGRHYIIVRDNVVVYQEYLIYGRIPLIDFHCVKHPDKFWADCYLTQAIPIQKQINLIVSQIINNLRFLGNPKIVSYKNNGLQRSNFVADVGEVLEVNVGGQAPYVLQGASMPNQVIQIINYLEGKMNDIFSQHEVSQGQLPYRIESAPALQELTEQDDAPISLTVMDFEDQLEVLGKAMLYIYGNNIDDRDERNIKVIGKNNVLEDSFILKASDLLDDFDVKAKVSPGLPHTKAGKTDMIFNLFDKGMLNVQDPEERRRGLDFLDFPFEESINVDEKQEKTNILLIKKGDLQLVTVNEYDNHVIHIGVMADYMKTQEYIMMKQTEPEKADFIFQHWTRHTQMMQGIMAEEQAMAEGGMPPEGGGAPMEGAPAGPIPFPGMEAMGGGV
jgi:hypothetical protein